MSTIEQLTREASRRDIEARAGGVRAMLRLSALSEAVLKLWEALEAGKPPEAWRPHMDALNVWIDAARARMDAATTMRRTCPHAGPHIGWMRHVDGVSETNVWTCGLDNTPAWGDRCHACKRTGRRT